MVLRAGSHNKADGMRFALHGGGFISCSHAGSMAATHEDSHCKRINCVSFGKCNDINPENVHSYGRQAGRLAGTRYENRQAHHRPTLFMATCLSPTKVAAISSRLCLRLNVHFEGKQTTQQIVVRREVRGCSKQWSEDFEELA